MKSRYNPDSFNRLEKNPENYKWGLFYFNPDDSRIIVPKRNQWMGWTLNFANLWSYVILAAITGLAVLIGMLADPGKI
jgi:uncharacterized membrane protein